MKTVTRGIERIKRGKSVRCTKIFKDMCIISINNRKAAAKNGKKINYAASQEGTSIGKKDPGVFFLRLSSAGLTNYVIRHMS